MRLDDYFDFEQLPGCQRIRLKGTRISIEDVLIPYLEGDSAERVFYNFRHTISLEQVYATITYYLNNKVRMEEYLHACRDFEKESYEEYRRQEPSEVMKRLREIKYQQKSVSEQHNERQDRLEWLPM